MSMIDNLHQKISNDLVNYSSVGEKNIDMSIINRIKNMRSQSRETADTLNKRREETIKNLAGLPKAPITITKVSKDE